MANDHDQQALKQSLFLRLKAITVPLLDLSRSPVSSTTTKSILDLLEKLCTILKEIPNGTLNPSLANYAFFPLTSLLQPRPDGVNRGDRVLESTMQTLKVLIEVWRGAGMENRARKELWTMTILTLGGPLKPAGGGKGKGKEVDRTEESKLAMVEVLEALMKPDSGLEEDDSLEGFSDPNDSTRGASPEATPPLSIVFHTLTTLLELASDPTSLVQLQLSSISSLAILTTHYLAPKSPSAGPGPSSLLATALPGMASTLSRIALSKPPSSKNSLETPSRKQTSSVVVEAIRLLSLLIESSVGDSVTSGLRAKGTDKTGTIVALEELADEFSNPISQSPDDETVPFEPLSNDTSSAAPGPTIPTPAWLRFTLSSISTLLTALSPLTSHYSPSVRAALVDLLARIVQRCSATFGSLLETPLEGLLILSGDEWEIVHSSARQALLDLLDDPISHTPSTPIDFSPLVLLGQIVHRRLVSLPLAFRKRDEESIRRCAGVVTTALYHLPAVDGSLDSLVSSISRWSWNLLGSFELEKVLVAQSGHRGGGGMALAWIRDERTQEDEFPRIGLRNLHDESTLRSLDKLWRTFGAAAGKVSKEDLLFDCFLGVALGPRRDESVATNALWILEGILRGFSDAKLDKRRKKLVRGVVKAVIGLIEDLETQEEDDPRPSEAPPAAAELLTGADETEDLLAIQHNKGVTPLPNLSEYNPVVARTTTANDRASHRILLLSLSLRIIATSATLLQSSFQSLLLPSLYHVLACSSSTTQPFLRAHAQAALSVIASSTSFPSSQDLVLANVDYVVNSVSQRMSVTRLDPSAPLVLVEMIRLVGQPIVAIVQDLVDDVFEALDDYHGYEEVTVGLWAVLDSLLKVMEEDLPVRAKDIPTKTSPSPEFDTFKAWYARRHDADKADEADLEEINPQRPFAPTPPSNEEKDPNEPTEFPESETKELPPSRAQVVTAQILSKALYFLSHPSPFLRGRVLSLLASAVPLLAQPTLDSTSPQNRSADLLPVIHRAWPFILNRLSDPDLSVVVEAATLIEALASHVGDFMSRRILDDVWPRFRTLLAKQGIDDRSSALSGSNQYSNSHRLYRSIIKTLLDVAKHVPLKEDVLWDQGLILRRFLSTGVHQELRDYAVELYQSLYETNRDAIWLVLSGTVDPTLGLPEFLAMEGLDFGGNIARILT
ncbi:hypothetical protein JCM16303_005081 [Sporobolomyces ruberrimus]